LAGLGLLLLEPRPLLVEHVLLSIQSAPLLVVEMLQLVPRAFFNAGVLLRNPKNERREEYGKPAVQPEGGLLIRILDLQYLPLLGDARRHEALEVREGQVRNLDRLASKNSRNEATTPAQKCCRFTPGRNATSNT